MRIVTDGVEFAIEKGRFFKKYQSLITKDNWWGVNDTCFSHCWGSKSQIERNWRELHRKHIIQPVPEPK